MNCRPDRRSNELRVVIFCPHHDLLIVSATFVAWNGIEFRSDSESCELEIMAAVEKVGYFRTPTMMDNTLLPSVDPFARLLAHTRQPIRTQRR